MSGTNIKLGGNTEREEAMASATRWLLEMELLNNPHMKNALMLNIYKVSDRIVDAEILVDERFGSMLIYLGLDGFGKLFKKKEISTSVLNMMQEALPSFRFRVIFDPILFLKAVNGLKRSLAAKPNPSAPAAPEIVANPPGEPLASAYVGPVPPLAEASPASVPEVSKPKTDSEEGA